MQLEEPHGVEDLLGKVLIHGFAKYVKKKTKNISIYIYISFKRTGKNSCNYKLHSLNLIYSLKNSSWKMTFLSVRVNYTLEGLVSCHCLKF